MKITTLFSVLFLFATVSLSAQSISEHALGLRLGDSDGFGAEISYQKSIGQYNRAEFDLGWRDSREFDAFKLTGVYQWVHQLDGNFNWYYGVGGGLGSVDFEPNPNFDDDNDGLFVFAAGDIGVEYDFDIPLWSVTMDSTMILISTLRWVSDTNSKFRKLYSQPLAPIKAKGFFIP
jgi:hypothetical protein